VDAEGRIVWIDPHLNEWWTENTDLDAADRMLRIGLSGSIHISMSDGMKAQISMLLLLLDAMTDSIDFVCLPMLWWLLFFLVIDGKVTEATTCSPLSFSFDDPKTNCLLVGWRIHTVDCLPHHPRHSRLDPRIEGIRNNT
jgi:hypothetical protein